MTTNSQDDTQNIEPEASVKPKRKLQDGRLKKTRQSQAAKHAAIIDLRMRGNSTSTIADAVALPLGTVKSILARFKPIFQELEQVTDYRTTKADLLAAGQLAALKSAMSGNKLEKAGFLSTLQGFEILNKAERLENNQSTENHAHLHGKLSLKKD